MGGSNRTIWGCRSPLALGRERLPAPTLPRLRRVSGNVSVTPHSPVALAGYVASVRLARHVCHRARPRGRCTQ
eukprot:204269-Pleurochrysis_carterae.AAC.1